MSVRKSIMGSNLTRMGIVVAGGYYCMDQARELASNGAAQYVAEKLPQIQQQFGSLGVSATSHLDDIAGLAAVGLGSVVIASFLKAYTSPRLRQVGDRLSGKKKDIHAANAYQTR